jgi:hypothetical protein
VSVSVGGGLQWWKKNIDNIYMRKETRTRAKCQERLKPKEG